jgi:hypothetical protein
MTTKSLGYLVTIVSATEERQVVWYASSAKRASHAVLRANPGFTFRSVKVW